MTGGWRVGLWLGLSLVGPGMVFGAAPVPGAGVPDTGAVAGMPLVEVPAAAPGSRLALFISGDGGWAGIDKDVARELAAKGVAVIGLNARSYLATRRTPEAVAEDMARVLRRYLELWGRDRVVLVGYSRGADLAPFIANRLPDDLRDRIDLVALLGIGNHAGFHVSLFDLLHSTTKSSDPATRPEVEAAHRAGIPMLCVYGTDEKESLCRDADDSLMIRIARSGAHHFDGDHAGLAADILQHLPKGQAQVAAPARGLVPGG